jgi:3alpha(or 20beta)-hydroxysteroid dehydrogenase
MGRLDGKVALITGGARGQGADEGALFASEGATVVLADVLDDVGRAAAAGIAGAEYTHLDVRSESEWQTVVDGVVARHGALDVLVNNAAIDLVKRLDATTLDEWSNLVAINQTGVFLGMRTAALAMMKVGRGGSIVNISSVAGLEAVKGHGAYSTTKWRCAASRRRRRSNGVATASG